MIRRTALFLVAASLLAARSATAQSGTADLAAAVVRALAPAVDDPDQLARDLVDTALAHRQSPAAAFLVDEVLRSFASLQRPADLLPTLAAVNGPLHGLLRQRLHELHWRGQRATPGGLPDPAGPYQDHVREALVVGPFGDGGDHFVGVPFAPELQFPDLHATLPGAGRPVVVRLAQRAADQRRIPAGDPRRDEDGCYYLLHRAEATQATAGWLEVEAEGDLQVFVDGGEVLRAEPSLEPTPWLHYVPLQLAAGAHEVLVKFASGDRHAAGLRWVDAAGQPLAQVRPLPVATRVTTTGAQREGAPFLQALDVFRRAAEAPSADAAVQLAALRCAMRQGATLLALQLYEPLRQVPPTEPVAALALAELATSLPRPEEVRAAEARSFQEAALAKAPADHHHARIVAARLLEQQDRREDALRGLAGHPAPGPETWALRLALSQRLHFDGEVPGLLAAWSAALPNDPRPRLELAELAADAGAVDQALALYTAALQLRADQPRAHRERFGLLLDAGRFTDAAAALASSAPALASGPTFGLLQQQLQLARAVGEPAGIGAAIDAVANHREADGDALARLADAALLAGAPARAVALLDQALAIDPDQPTLRAYRHELGAGPADGAEFAAFRHDAKAAIAAFTAGEAERTATSTLLIDQRIVEVYADGSWLAETHELRRINDLAGVEEWQSAAAAAQADETLVVRTLTADGQDFVPNEIDDDYSLQRLEPGVFVETRYRNRGQAPGAGGLRLERFLFRSPDAPVRRAELVWIRPAEGGRGDLRGNQLPPARSSRLADGRRVEIYTAEDQPRLVQERHLPSAGRLLPFAEIGEDAVVFPALREARQQLLRRTLVTASVAGVAGSVFRAGMDDHQRLAAAWDYAQREIESGEAESADHAILRRKGSRFLVTVALLRAAGIRVVPTACRDTHPDLTDGDDAVFHDGETFDTPAAMVHLADGSVHHLFLDTPRYWPLGAVPAQRAGTDAWALPGPTAERVGLPAAASPQQSIRAVGTAKVAGKDLDLQVTIELGDTAGFGLAERLRELQADRQQQVARQVGQQLLPGWRVTKARLDLDPPGRPFVLRVEARRAGLQPDGDFVRVALPMPPGKLVAGFGDRAERSAPARLPADLLVLWDITFDPGSAHRVVELPAASDLAFGGLHHQLQVEPGPGGLRLVRTLRLQPTEVPAARFGEWLRVLAAADQVDQASLRLQASPR